MRFKYFREIVNNPDKSIEDTAISVIIGKILDKGTSRIHLENRMITTCSSYFPIKKLQNEKEKNWI